MNLSTGPRQRCPRAGSPISRFSSSNFHQATRMKLKRQFLQIAATGFLLFAVLLALGSTRPEGGASIRNSGAKSTAIRVKSDSDHNTASSGHEDAASLGGSFGSRASRASGEITHGKMLEHHREPESSASEMNHDISFRDPIIARFPELESMMLRTIDPALAGHSLPAFGRRATVEEAGQVSGTTGMMLTLSIDPIAPTSEESPLSSESDVAAHPEIQSNPDIAAHSTTPNMWNRLSYEQELFRTKWGWQAFDQVQKVLREQTGP